MPMSSNSTTRDITRNVSQFTIKTPACSCLFQYIHNILDVETSKMSHNLWMNEKMLYFYTMEFYSVIKKNDILSFVGKWMELENIIFIEVSQIQKAKGHAFSLICEIEA
jgi:hypothetical protein